MTHDDLMTIFDRLKGGGCRVPDADREDVLFGEWFRALQHYPVTDVDAGVSRLLRDKRDHFWPSLGVMREAIATATAGRAQDVRCATCHGSGWVDAPPYRANGGLLYQGVVRCPDCGIPAPKTDWLRGQHTPIDGAELCEWARETHAEPLTQAEMLARCRAITARMAMPKLRLVERD